MDYRLNPPYQFTDGFQPSPLPELVKQRGEFSSRSADSSDTCKYPGFCTGALSSMISSLAVDKLPPGYGATDGFGPKAENGDWGDLISKSSVVIFIITLTVATVIAGILYFTMVAMRQNYIAETKQRAQFRQILAVIILVLCAVLFFLLTQVISTNSTMGSAIDNFGDPSGRAISGMHSRLNRMASTMDEIFVKNRDEVFNSLDEIKQKIARDTFTRMTSEDYLPNMTIFINSLDFYSNRAFRVFETMRYAFRETINDIGDDSCRAAIINSRLSYFIEDYLDFSWAMRANRGIVLVNKLFRKFHNAPPNPRAQFFTLSDVQRALERGFEPLTEQVDQIKRTLSDTHAETVYRFRAASMRMVPMKKEQLGTFNSVRYFTIFGYLILLCLISAVVAAAILVLIQPHANLTRIMVLVAIAMLFVSILILGIMISCFFLLGMVFYRGCCHANNHFYRSISRGCQFNETIYQSITGNMKSPLRKLGNFDKSLIHRLFHFEPTILTSRYVKAAIVEHANRFSEVEALDVFEKFDCESFKRMTRDTDGTEIIELLQLLDKNCNMTGPNYLPMVKEEVFKFMNMTEELQELIKNCKVTKKLYTRNKLRRRLETFFSLPGILDYANIGNRNVLLKQPLYNAQDIIEEYRTRINNYIDSVDAFMFAHLDSCKPMVRVANKNTNDICCLSMGVNALWALLFIQFFIILVLIGCCVLLLCLLPSSRSVDRSKSFPSKGRSFFKMSPCFKKKRSSREIITARGQNAYATPDIRQRIVTTSGVGTTQTLYSVPPSSVVTVPTTSHSYRLSPTEEGHSGPDDERPLTRPDKPDAASSKESKWPYMREKLPVLSKMLGNQNNDQSSVGQPQSGDRIASQINKEVEPMPNSKNQLAIPNRDMANTSSKMSSKRGTQLALPSPEMPPKRGILPALPSPERPSVSSEIPPKRGPQLALPSPETPSVSRTMSPKRGTQDPLGQAGTSPLASKIASGTKGYQGATPSGSRQTGNEGSQGPKLSRPKMSPAKITLPTKEKTTSGSRQTENEGTQGPKLSRPKMSPAKITLPTKEKTTSGSRQTGNEGTQGPKLGPKVSPAKISFPTKEKQDAAPPLRPKITPGNRETSAASSKMTPEKSKSDKIAKTDEAAKRELPTSGSTTPPRRPFTVIGPCCKLCEETLLKRSEWFSSRAINRSPSPSRDTGARSDRKIASDLASAARQRSDLQQQSQLRDPKKPSSSISETTTSRMHRKDSPQVNRTQRNTLFGNDTSSQNPTIVFPRDTDIGSFRDDAISRRSEIIIKKTGGCTCVCIKGCAGMVPDFFPREPRRFERNAASRRSYSETAAPREINRSRAGDERTENSRGDPDRHALSASRSRSRAGYESMSSNLPGNSRGGPSVNRQTDEEPSQSSRYTRSLAGDETSGLARLRSCEEGCPCKTLAIARLSDGPGTRCCCPASHEECLCDSDTCLKTCNPVVTKLNSRSAKSLQSSGLGSFTTKLKQGSQSILRAVTGKKNENGEGIQQSTMEPGNRSEAPMKDIIPKKVSSLKKVTIGELESGSSRKYIEKVQASNKGSSVKYQDEIVGVGSVARPEVEVIVPREIEYCERSCDACISLLAAENSLRDLPSSVSCPCIIKNEMRGKESGIPIDELEFCEKGCLAGSSIMRDRKTPIGERSNYTVIISSDVTRSPNPHVSMSAAANSQRSTRPGDIERNEKAPDTHVSMQAASLQRSTQTRHVERAPDTQVSKQSAANSQGRSADPSRGMSAAANSREKTRPGNIEKDERAPDTHVSGSYTNEQLEFCEKSCEACLSLMSDPNQRREMRSNYTQMSDEYYGRKSYHEVVKMVSDPHASIAIAVNSKISAPLPKNLADYAEKSEESRLDNASIEPTKTDPNQVEHCERGCDPCVSLLSPTSRVGVGPIPECACADMPRCSLYANDQTCKTNIDGCHPVFCHNFTTIENHGIPCGGGPQEGGMYSMNCPCPNMPHANRPLLCIRSVSDIPITEVPIPIRREANVPFTSAACCECDPYSYRTSSFDCPSRRSVRRTVWQLVRNKCWRHR